MRYGNVCTECRHEAAKKTGVDFRFRESGLNNVFLKNAVVYECECGAEVKLPLFCLPLSLAIVDQLVQKPANLIIDEFTYIWKTFFLAAQVNRVFAESIGFFAVDLIKFSEFASDNSIDENDKIINDICTADIRSGLATALGFSNAAEMVSFGHGSIRERAQPVSGELDARLRALYQKVADLPKYRSYSDCDGPNQKIFVVLPDNLALPDNL